MRNAAAVSSLLASLTIFVLSGGCCPPGSTASGGKTGGATGAGQGSAGGVSAGTGSFEGGGNNGGGTGGNGSGGSATAGNCAQGAQWIYTVDINNTLSAFHPDTLTFNDIGTLSCPANQASLLPTGGAATPFSMGVDRNAVAWVLYSDGQLFQVDTSSASCQSTTFQDDQQGFQLFGMGFSSNSTTASPTATDTLFIGGGAASTIAVGSAELGNLSFPGLAVAPVGTLTAGWPELTGTGDGELWGFFPSDNATTGTAGTVPSIAQLDKTSGNATTTFQLPNLAGVPAAWAQGFYGGSFWIFLARMTDASTAVYQVKRSDGTETTPIAATNRIIVGAGVSTCAPTTFE